MSDSGLDRPSPARFAVLQWFPLRAAMIPGGLPISALKAPEIADGDACFVGAIDKSVATRHAPSGQVFLLTVLF
jgi:hypothetical protein